MHDNAIFFTLAFTLWLKKYLKSSQYNLIRNFKLIINKCRK